MTVRTFIDSAVENLSGLYPKAEAKSLAFRLLEHFLEMPSYKYIAEPDLILPENEKSEAISGALEQLCTGRPLQYVLGYAEFCGHRFKVREGCLIPRPETEELVYRIADEYSDYMAGEEGFNILDLCTGSGCIAYSLAAEFPEAMVYGCDISDDALAIACRQKVKLLGARPVLFKADILQDPPAGLPEFDIIVSNPPYVCEGERVQMRENVLSYEPAEALFVPDDDPLLFYRAVARWAESRLKPSGRIYLEINERFPEQTSALFPGSTIYKDINGKDRYVVR